MSKNLRGAATGRTLGGRINACDVLTVSAYGIAVKNGFEGTEEEWLKSLKGEKGDKGDMTFNGVIPDDTGNIQYPPIKRIAPEQILTFTETNGLQSSVNLILAEPLKVGSTYKVVWGDEEFICKCYDKAEGGTLYLSNPMLGNASLFLNLFPDTGEPFYIVDNRAADNGTMLVIKSSEDTTTNITIYLQEQLATEEYVREYVRPYIGEFAGLTDAQIAAAVAAYMAEHPVPGASSERIAEVKLLAASWLGDKSPYSQVVAIPGITNYSQVDLTPSVEQLAIFYEKDITFVTENDGGVVTVYVIGQKPQNDYTIQANIVEVIA